MRYVVYNSINDRVINEMQAAGIYATFIQQINRVALGPRQIFVFIDSAPNRLTYFIYHRGFALESDNGFSAIGIENPAAYPEVVSVVDQAVRETFDSEIGMLWVDNPLCRN